MSEYFEELVKSNKKIITEGAIVERLKGEHKLLLDSQIMHAGFIYDSTKRDILKNIYKQYINIGIGHSLPIMLTTPTRRANYERVQESEYRHKLINEDCVQFLKGIREEYSEHKQKEILIGGLMGCKNDAYNAEEALTVEESLKFHNYQVKSFIDSDVDFIMAAVLPAVSEALGIASLLSLYNKPYVLSFVIRGNGKLLDGTTLHDTISMIDSIVSNKPTFYMVNCVHPEVLMKGLSQEYNKTPLVNSRLLGIQANASKQTPEELEGGEKVVLDTVENIVKRLMELHNNFNINVLGGCCGTNDKHILDIANKLIQS